LTVHEHDAIVAFQYFDRNHTGYLRINDVETLIYSLGYALSRAYVHDLVSSVCERSKLHYNVLCSKLAQNSINHNNMNISTNELSAESEPQGMSSSLAAQISSSSNDGNVNDTD
jgi:Ca2+-binding EF-hand superfamily protein